MEFSFDRPHQPRPVQPQPVSKEPPREAVAASSAEPARAEDSADHSNVANERLRKAIEKNRARQAERAKLFAAQNQHQAAQVPPQIKPQPQAQPEVQAQAEQIREAQIHEQASFFDKQQAAAHQERVSPADIQPKERPRAEERTAAQREAAPKTSAVITRRSVARADEADFTPVKRTPKKVASQISYTTNKKKAKPIDPKLVTYLVKGSWIFCGLMVLRLIFANGGVSDFYSQKNLHNDRLEELGRIKKENMALVHEIERMQTDAAFQKKLVRDNLGFIAKDEYLLLFPKEN